MKKVFLICLIVLFPLAVWAGPGYQIVNGGGVPAAGENCSGCVNGVDDSLLASVNNATTSNDSTYWYASQFVVGSPICMTGLYANLNDGGATAGVTSELYDDSAGDPGSIVGVGFTATVANVPDDRTDTDFIFAATQYLPAGTYWIVRKPDGTVGMGHQGASGDGTHKYSTDSGSSWDSISNYYEAGYYGCTIP